MTMIINGIEFRTTQDERMQHALLVRPAAGDEWRVYIRHYSAHVVSAAVAALKRDVLRHGWDADRINDLPFASFRLTRRGRELLEAA